MPFYTDKGIFWSYLRDTLAWPQISEPGPLAAVMHGIASYNDKVLKEILWLRDQFIVPLAEDEFIPFYGESRGVPRNRFDTAEKYRLRVEKAFEWHMLAAKEQGLPKILAEYGFEDGKIKNVRHENPELWAHFDVTLVKPPADFGQKDVEAVFDLANENKPGRSVIRKIQFANQSAAPLRVGAYAQVVVIVDHYVKAKEAAPPGPAPLYIGAANNVFVIVEHRIRG